MSLSTTEVTRPIALAFNQTALGDHTYWLRASTIGALGAGLFLFIYPAIGYLCFAQVLPALRLSFVFVCSLFIVTLLRAASAVTGQQPLTGLGFAGALLTLLSLIQVAWFPAISEHGGTDEYLVTTAATCVTAWLMAFCGEALGTVLRGQGGRSVIAALWVTMLALVATAVYANLINLFNGGSASGFWSYDATTRSHFDYITFSDGLAIISLVLIGLYAQRVALATTIYVTVCLALGFSCSRTSLYLFIIAGLLPLLKARGNLFKLVAALFLFAAVILAATLWGRFDHDVLFSTRMGVLLRDPSDDDSFNARLMLAHDGLQRIWTVGLFGRFMNDWWDQGQLGDYIHNVLSFWECYGIIPFIVIILLCLRLVYRLVKMRFEGAAAYPSAVAVWFYVFAAILLSRSYVWPFLWFGLTFTATVTDKRD